MTLYVGTSGWAYREWKPDFYPEDLPQKRFLEHYSSVMSACEINATFYRLQKPETIAGWAASVPEGFRFSAKAHRGLTHTKLIDFEEDSRKSLLDAYITSVRSFGGRIGVVLFQYPPYRRRDDDAFARVLNTLATYEGLRFAFEFRHESWDGIEQLIAERGATVCLSETEGRVPESLPPGPHAYIRLRTDRYGSDERDSWATLLEKEGAERDVYAFAKHEGIPAGDPFGGVGLAQWLVGRSRTPTPAPIPLAGAQAEDVRREAELRQDPRTGR